tara:strand:- start:304 stop:1011 length:708 start_codon:yes stop_codon:yes gene_type:complete
MFKGFRNQDQQSRLPDPMGPMQGNPLEQPGSADPYQSASAQIREPGTRAAPEDRYDELTGEIKKRADFGLATGAVPVQRFKAGSLTSTDLDRGFDEYDLEDYEEEAYPDPILISTGRYGRRPIGKRRPAPGFQAGKFTVMGIPEVGSPVYVPHGLDEPWGPLGGEEEGSMAGGDAIGQGDPSQTQQPKTREDDEVFQAHRYDNERLPLSDPFTQNLKPKFAEFVSRRNQIARGNF